jgi:hypothetical protein
MTDIPDTSPWQRGTLIALGGDAAVFHATFEGEGPLVGTVGALKVARRTSATASLLREARILQRVNHPHLPRLLEAAFDGTWLVTEHIDGDTLDVWALGPASDGRPGPGQAPSAQPVDAVVGIGLEMVGALRHLHARQIVHADLTPRNVMIDASGHVKLLDVGGAPPAPTAAGVIGTPGFVAPELLTGGKPSPATDAWGLGACLYAALSGRAPFSSADPAAASHATVTSSPLPPSSWRTDLPTRLDRLVLSLLTRDPHKRPDLRTAEADLSRCWASLPATRPTLGMVHAREELHREVSRAASGRPVVVVLYGPTGSGRRTLAQEAVRQAQREGFRFLEHVDGAAFLAEQSRGTRPVMVARARKADMLAVARTALGVRKPALLVLYDHHPVPELDARRALRITPDPLDLASIQRMAASLGLDAGVASHVRDLTHGHPGATWRALAARGRRPMAPTPLSKDAERILVALREQRGGHAVLALARALKLPPQTLLDECEPLRTANQIAFSADGRTVQAVQRP